MHGRLVSCVYDLRWVTTAAVGCCNNPLQGGTGEQVARSWPGVQVLVEQHDV